ncbi:hypothetical protein FACS1894187_22770 [Synergistales bacterium]|nr:hypothetical protein FACS1894187_22770 [Synergistales bacterium]
MSDKAINPKKFQELLDKFDLVRLFIEELGWDNAVLKPQKITVDGEDFTLTPLAQKRGVAIFRCSPDREGKVPHRTVTLALEKEALKIAHEHLLIFADKEESILTWLWVSRVPGEALRSRTHTWRRGQSSEPLRQKLGQIVWSLEAEEAITLTDVITGLRGAFDRDRVSKQFYDLFKKQHDDFSKFIKGLSEATEREWYASLMLNRLMFVYFIQKKGFLDGDENYLAGRLKSVQEKAGKGKFHSFYRVFLRRLFHEGLGKPKPNRSPELTALIGDIPYLNGGLFALHELEEARPDIDVSDDAFENLFAFFDKWDWHLDNRPLRSGREINPDVLGYIFEKYINQKQMGAYYTKEDITGYISRNTVIPHLLETVRLRCKVAFEGETSVWNLLKTDPDRYIYPAMKTGVVDANDRFVPETALPDFVQADMNDAKARMFDRRYNLGEAVFETATGERGTLPTETWREYADRRKRCLSMRERLAGGEVRGVDDLITLNLDICQFMQDIIANASGPNLLRAIWQAIAGRVPEKSNETFRHGITVLDPTCGSGAFLFAALNILEPLYEACLDRMEGFCDDAAKLGRPAEADFAKILGEANKHPSRSYYVYKNIILNNLFGVDIMPDAVEICKLRMFLKLVSQVDSAKDLEPLPDIDFNIRAGNTLVGYATEKQFYGTDDNLFNKELKNEIKARIADLADCFDRFREQQTVYGGLVTAEDKRALRDKLSALAKELDVYLAADYKIPTNDKDTLAAWRASHQPFHWFAEFYSVMRDGGFDVVIGNPPYLEYSKVSEYSVSGFMTEQCNNLYTLTVERSLSIVHKRGRLGLIVPISIACSGKLHHLRDLLCASSRSLWLSHFSNRPGQLFTGAQNRLTIMLTSSHVQTPVQLSTKYYRWHSRMGERDALFSLLQYQLINNELMSFHRLLPKVGSKDMARIARKIQSNITLGISCKQETPNKIYWVRVPGYFCQFFVSPPMVTPENGGRPRQRGEVNAISLNDKKMQTIAHAILNSSIYYLFFCSYTDTRHVNSGDVTGFPLNLVALEKSIGTELSSLSEELSECFSMNTSKQRKSGLLIDSVDSKSCKPIIDRIDSLLAEHFGFSQEELDVVINYDIKYRMGGADEENIEA